VPWVILEDGNGTLDNGFKGEWMTVKDGNLYVGSHGTEFVSREGVCAKCQHAELNCMLAVTRSRLLQQLLV
jgi:hypothetical protein